MAPQKSRLPRARRGYTSRLQTLEDDATRHPTRTGIHPRKRGVREVDEASAYTGVPFEHFSCNHGKGEYVSSDGATTNGVENFWTLLKRGYRGIHGMSPKHLERYLREFSGRPNHNDLPVLEDHSCRPGVVEVRSR